MFAMIDMAEADVQELKEKLSSAKKVLDWNHALFSYMGIEPVNFNNTLYGLIILYSTALIILTCLYFPTSLKHQDQSLNAVAELLIYTVWLLKLIIFKQKSPILFGLLANLSADFSIDKFASAREVNIFIGYMSLAKKFIKYGAITATVTCIIYNLRTFIINGFHIPMQTDSNNITTYLPPYRIKFYYPLTDLTMYMIAWLYCSPVILLGIFYNLSDANMLVTLVAHACGQLAILSQCYFELLGDYPKQFQLTVTKAIQKNYYIIRFVRDINLVFSLMMLLQRINSVFVLCFFLYSTVTTWDESENIALLFNGATAFGFLLINFAYSYVGQCLIDESLYLNDALCKCTWYNLKSQDLKYYLILLVHARKPLYINCGNFFVFSLDSFITVIKSAMAYVSVLRTVT